MWNRHSNWGSSRSWRQRTTHLGGTSELMDTANDSGTRRLTHMRWDRTNRLFAFYDWCSRADVPEVTTLARTIEAWWPQILAFIDTGITNAATEATNRMVKDAARIAFGFRNLGNQRRRVRLHSRRTITSQPMRG
jgi:transposase